MPFVITNAPFSNRIQLVCSPLIGPFTSTTLGAFDPTRDMTVWVDGNILEISSFTFDAPNNRYLLYAATPFNLEGIIQVTYHTPNPPFMTSTCNTVTTMTATPNPAVHATPVVLQAVVVPSFGGVLVPTGSVQFYDGVTTIGSPATMIAGVAQVSTSSLTIGTHDSIHAVYIPIGLFNASTSNSVTEVIT